MPHRAAFAHALIALAVALATALPAAAAERREAGKHEHGAGELRVAIDGGDVEVELEGPAANFVGFEHAPRTAAEQRAIDAALATLGAPAQLFAWPAAAGCRPAGTEVTGPEYGADDDHDDHEAADHADEVHTEFSAVYAFRCTNPAALDGLRVLVFAKFPGTARLAAGVVGPAGQSGATLTPASPVLPLRP